MALRAIIWGRIVQPQTTRTLKKLFAGTSTRQIAESENGLPVMLSVLNCAKRLFGGFEEIVGITIVEEDRSEIFDMRKHLLFG